jgi:hypothetical protein
MRPKEVPWTIIRYVYRLCLTKPSLVFFLALQAGSLTPTWADSQLNASVDFQDHYSTTATSEIRRLATQGDPHAQTQLAHLYANGTGVPQNYKEAINWYRRAAIQGYQPAREALKSLGVPLVSERMIYEVDKASDGSSPGVADADRDARARQSSRDRNIVTINIITNEDVSARRDVVDVGAIPSAILLPREHFKALRHPGRRKDFVKPRSQIGNKSFTRRFGVRQKLHPHRGAGRAKGLSRGIGRTSIK